VRQTYRSLARVSGALAPDRELSDRDARAADKRLPPRQARLRSPFHSLTSEGNQRELDGIAGDGDLSRGLSPSDDLTV